MQGADVPRQKAGTEQSRHSPSRPQVPVGARSWQRQCRGAEHLPFVLHSLRTGWVWGWLHGLGADGGPACLALAAVFAFLGFTENESDIFFYLVSAEFMLVEN